MDALRHLTARGNDNDNRNDNDNGGLNSSSVNLLISLLALILLSIALIGSYLVLRRRRQKQQSELPLYQDHRHNSSSNRRQRGRGLTISASNRDSVFLIGEKGSSSPSSSSSSSLSPPSSPVPEIRITFPEEEDAAGKRMSGRVVVVRISEKGGIGLEPLDEGREDGGRKEGDEDLPPYQQRQPGGSGSGKGGSTERFQSLDLERMGGLKEKEMDEKRWA
ncbi:hypothetical protein RJZ56_003246 [Blastomyces dermatitidis]|uniref:Uncharacterized protein n=3 Tax=Blastomyces TaxID=229219 RepID=A0A179UQJ9_BLAGS|nr:uncharacterized protein BDBG_05250 [Blastomyces gilchristii SLH14081]XP_045278070.1 uncharacterized protein BDCG_06677 [Blastomyces dermatitidis ER-3]EGE85658.1 hypothetical protein BDDG_08603 [Blastomyces dermatitidis ATCC 18188]EQL33833.1 hypothetical protein BDFG_04218 [Blastomyces dermatitidis ATCC 26199]EEQ91557.1 hypothetical protein BDCG_06677 [Blastomyces dermatitidis ER-3]OAT09479.1 hypothetical protein BDBG_05250 [Blastomyces gilchristii SLH14081]